MKSWIQNRLFIAIVAPRKLSHVTTITIVTFSLKSAETKTIITTLEWSMRKWFFRTYYRTEIHDTCLNLLPFIMNRKPIISYRLSKSILVLLSTGNFYIFRDFKICFPKNRTWFFRRWSLLEKNSALNSPTSRTFCHLLKIVKVRCPL